LSYVGDYLKEDVAAESLNRGLSGFATFLEAAALSDGEVVSFASFAREVGFSQNTIREYFDIHVDSLIGSFLPAYTKRAKRRTTSAPKFYFHDIGVVNHLARRGQIELGSELSGKAFENWVAHELRSYNEYADRLQHLSCWRLTTGVEVDFVIGDMLAAIEAKCSSAITTAHCKNLRQLGTDFPQVGRRIIVYVGEQRRTTDDGIEILPYNDFLTELWNGAIF
jgi:uncharacterized protein